MSRQRTLLTVVAGLLVCWFVCFPEVGTAQSKKVAVIWDTKSAMADAVFLGFSSKFRQIAPDVELKVYRHLKNMEEAEKVYRDVEPTVDGIVFLRSAGAEFLAKQKPIVPCFIGATNNPVDLGAVKNLNAPEGMITGVTYFIPYEKRFQIIQSLFPNLKSVGLLVEKGHPGGPIDRRGTAEQCQRLQLGYHEAVVSNLNELLEGARNLAGKVDLFIISSTRLAMDNVVNLLPVANASRTPMFAYADKPVKAGAVAGVAADDVKLGGMLAESVMDVVVKGKPVSQVPVKTDPNPRILINKGMMNSLGLKFPDAVLKEATFVD